MSQTGLPMADPLHRLLELQDLDIAADQLRYRREHLPDRAELAAASSAVTVIERRLTGLRATLEGLGTTQRRLEDEVGAIEARATAEDAKLYGGSITAPRELEALQAELAALGRSRSAKEDELLEVMEQAEEPTAEVERLVVERTALERSMTELVGRLGEDEAAIDADLGRNLVARAALADELPAPLLIRYESLRTRLDGVGAARLEGGRCTGCHLSLPSTELDAVRRAGPDTVVIHEECGRILVP